MVNDFCQKILDPWNMHNKYEHRSKVAGTDLQYASNHWICGWLGGINIYEIFVQAWKITVLLVPVAIGTRLKIAGRSTGKLTSNNMPLTFASRTGWGEVYTNDTET